MESQSINGRRRAAELFSVRLVAVGERPSDVRCTIGHDWFLPSYVSRIKRSVPIDFELGAALARLSFQRQIHLGTT
jgi:hypothetical protein